MTRPDQVPRFTANVEATLVGEHLADRAVDRVVDGIADREVLLRAVLAAAGSDGWPPTPPGPALCACVARLQKRIETLGGAR